MHLLIWKHLITHLTKISTEDATLSTHEIWRLAWNSFQTKAEAKAEALKERVRAARARGKDPPDVSGSSRLIEPIGRYDARGEIRWDINLKAEIESLAKAPEPGR